ncbi:MAG: hypothetical protein ACHQIH_00015 [Ignavibacteria bacterium]
MPEISEYKGNKLICLNPGSKFTFSFGLAKAKMIIENLDSIKKFIETNGESCGEPSEGGAGSESGSKDPF